MTDFDSRIVGIMSAAAAGEEQWVQLLPLGMFQGKDGRGPYNVITRKAAEAVITASLRHHGEADIVVDYDHQSDFAAKPGVGGQAPAAGWITELAARDDGIWGRVEWTDAAAEKLRTREYRYLSPVFAFDRSSGAIQRAGLTNNPNLHLKAVASADMSNPDHLAELRSIFGLTDGADMAAVVEAARAAAAKEINAVDPSRFVPIETLEQVTAELNRLVSKGISTEAATIAVNSAVETGKLPPMLKDWGVALCQQDRSAFDAFLGKTGGAFTHLTEVRLPGGRPHAIHSATGVEAEIARNLGLNADELKA